MDSPGGAYLPVGDGHQIWVERWGIPDGRPVLFLHGGPGSGCQRGHRDIFDPSHFQVVFVDQRGAGRSRPHGRREANTTWHLVADLETVRAALGLERWLVVGGSWGATLALAYAQTHPERVSGLVLRSIFLGMQTELSWAFETALAKFFPELHRDFLDRLPAAERETPLPAYWRRILDPDPEIHVPAALAWHDTERILSEILPRQQRLHPPRWDVDLPATPFMEAHYFSNDCFLTERQLLSGTSRLVEIPCRIIQARYDMLCPPANAARLVERWPSARIDMVEAAGHSLSHAGVADAMRCAMAEFVPGHGSY